MIGQKINNYEITALLGEGGMGSVYLAEHPVIKRRVAIKILRRELSDNQELIARFFNEARASSSIRHRNIVDVLDLGTLDSGVPYMIMEHLQGESLAENLSRHRKLSVPVALGLLAQVVDALEAAHANGIVHRDLKPENLFLIADAEQPGGQRIKVLDFGIAKLHGGSITDSVKTKTGSVLGTPFYMSPEQCRGLSDEIDGRTDVYALGAILFEMLCGRPPFVSSGMGDILVKHVIEAVPDPRGFTPDLPAHVLGLIGQALEKEKQRRFPTMAAFGKALRDPDSANLRACWAHPPQANADTGASVERVETGSTRLLVDSAVAPPQTRVLSDVATPDGGNVRARRGSVTTLGSAAQAVNIALVDPPAVRRSLNRVLMASAGALALVGLGFLWFLPRTGGLPASTGPVQAPAPSEVVPAPSVVTRLRQPVAGSAMPEDLQAPAVPPEAPHKAQEKGQQAIAKPAHAPADAPAGEARNTVKSTGRRVQKPVGGSETHRPAQAEGKRKVPSLTVVPEPPPKPIPKKAYQPELW